MSDEWDGKIVMSTPGGPIVTLSLGEVLARKDAEIERMRAENERLQRSFDDGYLMLEATQQANDKLRSENELLREALTDIANQETTGPYKWQSVVEHLCEIAREALEGER